MTHDCITGIQTSHSSLFFLIDRGHILSKNGLDTLPEDPIHAEVECKTTLCLNSPVVRVHGGIGPTGVEAS